MFVSCLCIDRDDSLLYAGTRGGEVLEVQLRTGKFTRNGPVGKIFKGGVNCINGAFNHIFVGCQVGTLAKMDKKTFLFQEEVQIGQGPINALANSSE